MDGNDAAEKWMAGDLKLPSGQCKRYLYVDLWNQVESKLLPSITEYLWTSPHATQSILGNVLKARYGQLWNMNLAYVRKMAYNRG